MTRHRCATAALGLLVLLLLLPLLVATAADRPNAADAADAAPPSSSLADRFIERRGARLFFANTTRPFYFVGANLLFPTDSAHLPDPLHRQRLLRALDSLSSAGVGVIRIWAFNEDAPRLLAGDEGAAAVLYDRAQIAALDLVVWAAKARGMRVIPTLTSFWTPYKRFEEYAYPQRRSTDAQDDNNELSAEEAARLAAAEAERAGSDVGGWYRAPSSPRFAAATAAYKKHAYSLMMRLNPLTGLRYNEDPAILAWAVVNEPRFPGGFGAGDQRAHWRWLNDVASFVKTAAPKQLLSISTEGFFVDNSGAAGGGADADADTDADAAIAASARAARAGALLQHNPGAGSACEGEDWLALSAIPDVDLVSMHGYERQMEWRPESTPGAVGDNPSWFSCGVDDCYLPWLRSALALRAALSGAGGSQGGETVEETVAAAAGEDPIAGATAARVLLPPLVVAGAEIAETAAAFPGLGKPFVFRLVLGMARRAAAAGTGAAAENAATTTTSQDGLAAMAGVMFWQASGNDTADSDGYVVRVDRPGVLADAAAAAAAGGGSASSSSPLPLPTPTPRLATPEQAEAFVAGEAAAVEAAKSKGNGSRWWDPTGTLLAAPPDLAAQMMMVMTRRPTTMAVPPMPPTTPTPMMTPAPTPTLPLDPARTLINTLSPGNNAGRRRSLLWGQDTLDAFRRGPQREACAVKASETWRPYREFNLTRWTEEDDAAALRDLTPSSARLRRWGRNGRRTWAVGEMRRCSRWRWRRG